MRFQTKEIYAKGVGHTQHRRDYKQVEEVVHSEDGRRVSEAEYWENYYEDDDFHYEWNNGILEEKPVSDHGAYLMSIWFTSVLQNFLYSYPIGTTIGLEMGFRLNLPKKVSIRKPDIGVILNSNSVGITNRDCTFHGVVDMCIEILSDTSRKAIERDTKTKKQEYGRIKVKEYYILDRKQKHTNFYHLAPSGRYIKIKPKQGILQSIELPGFQFRISDLYQRPDIKQMSEDPVYQAFCLPFYQQEKQRAEQEKQRAEKEKQKAEKEKQRAEQEKQRADNAEQRIKQEKQKAEKEKQRADNAEQRIEQTEVRAKLLEQQLAEEKEKLERLLEAVKQQKVLRNSD